MKPIYGKTAVYGVIGDPIEHSLSPLMQNAAIASMGIDAVYVPFHVKPEELECAIRGMVALGIRGLNVTVPHKTSVMKYLDHLTDMAITVGAVNTIINDGGVLVGDNTDIYGFIMCLRSGGGLDLFPEKVCILGAGGAARGVAHACLMRDEVRELTILNRTYSKAVQLAQELGHYTGKKLTSMHADYDHMKEAIPEAGLVLNTTSVGMYPAIECTPVPYPELFREGQIVCDIIYNPPETRFLRDAASQGAKTVCGLSMLAHQGARSLSLWTGLDVPADVMLEVLISNLGKVDSCVEEELA